MKPTSVAGICLLALCLVPGSRVATAQGLGASADLTGTISDPAGATVPNAKVTVTDTARGVQRTAVTDDRGHYRVSGLAPSSYAVRVEHPGFQTELASGVSLTVGQTVILDFQLKLSEMAAQVV